MINILAVIFLMFSSAAFADVYEWQREFPKADFTNHTVPYKEILSGGVPRDGIPAIDKPKFAQASELNIKGTEPVIGLNIGGEFKAYPLRILMFHEIVNDTLAGVPISVTYCPLCNSSIVFKRNVKGQVLDFGTTGRLRNSDLVMYDRQTETFFQQAMGVGIVGTLAGTSLEMIPSRLESIENYIKRAGPDALVLVPSNARPRQYGTNPYEGYDEAYPFLYKGEMPEGIEPMQRVVTTQDRNEAFKLTDLREKGTITASDGTIFTWTQGQNTALGNRVISKGKDIGNVTATLKGADVVYFVEFAFVFHAFTNGGEIK